MLHSTHSSSLRTRFLWIAASILSLVLGGTVWGLLSLYRIQEDVSNNLHARHELLEMTNTIRLDLLEAYRSLDIYLLEPGKTTASAHSIESIKKALLQSEQLQRHIWTRENGQVSTTIELKSLLEQILYHIETVIQVRSETTQQYPSMAVGNQVMNPARNLVENAFLVIFNELTTELTYRTQPQVYIEFVETRRLWMQMLSNFRLYLANRIGTFDEAALPIQERSIETLYDRLQTVFNKLVLLDNKDKLGFESSTALNDLISGTQKWFEGFTRTQVIHHSSEWRVDTKMIKEDVIPTVDKINHVLFKLEAMIQKRVDSDVNAYTELARKHMLLLWVVAMAAFAFIAVIIWSGNRLLFRPLEIITRALHAESLGNQVMSLPESKVKETQELVNAFSEMRHQVHQRQAELEYRALHDGLTSLPNRVLLMDHINHDIALAKRDFRVLSLMVLDLDHFKEINDTLGHTIGDRLLIEVGNRFRSCLRDCDTVARLGGDEFAVLLPNTGAQGACKIADDIIGSLRDKIIINDMQLFVTVSIGIAEFPAHAENAQMLLQHADVAMYVAKQNQSGYALYNPDEDQYSMRRLAIHNDFRTAINHSELTLYYQPIISIQNNRVIGGEALLRWHSKEHGAVSPDLLIDLAEQTALISPLTNWVVSESLQQARIWQKNNLDIYISVNLSMHNLREENLVENVKALLEINELPSDILTLEITESAMMFNPGQVIKVLQELDKMGVKLAIDDFGTGFSSLAYLKQLPVSQIKIDKSFVTNLANDSSDQAIVRATLSLAQSLGLLVVVEGVEDGTSWNLLKTLNCYSAQGFYLGHPMPAEDFVIFVKKYNSQSE